jgi:hypothetical protein
MSRLSPEFEALWRDNDVRVYGEGTKRLHHATLGFLEMEYSGFAVDGRPDLHMVVYNAVSSTDADLIRALIDTTYNVSAENKDAVVA